MGIELLRYEGDPQHAHHTHLSFPGSVVHFGADPPANHLKHRVIVSGASVAPHHAKLFWSQDSYWLVNLCGLPCAVLKASGRTVYLTVLEPATRIRELEGFQIGEDTFIACRLERPARVTQQQAAPFDPALAELLQREAAVIAIPDRYTPSHPVVWQTALQFSTELIGYENAEQMWRQTVDRLLDGFMRRWLGDKPEPSLLFAAAQPDAKLSGLSSPFFRQSLPRQERVPGEEVPFPAATGLPHALPTTLAALSAGAERPLHFQLVLPERKGLLHLFVGGVFKEATTVGTVALGVAWPSGHEPHFPEHDDVYLFVHLLNDLSLNLTLLEQRRQALRFERLHDLGIATLNAAHDETHLIELITPPFGTLSDLAGHIASNCVTCDRGYRPLSDAVSRIRAVADQVHGIARTTVEFAMEFAVGKKRPGPTIADCSDGVRNWFEQLAKILNDSCIDVEHHYADDADHFCADLRFVLATLRNLEVNSVRAIHRAARNQGRVRLEASCRSLPRGDTADPLTYIVLSVADNGEGIDEMNAQQLFKGRVVDSASGYGLGTQIIRWVMDQHRGLIRLAAKPGVGAIVELWFPRLTLGHSLSVPSVSIEAQWISYAQYRVQNGTVQFLQNHPWLDQLAQPLRIDSHPVPVEVCS